MRSQIIGVSSRNVQGSSARRLKQIVLEAAKLRFFMKLLRCLLLLKVQISLTFCIILYSFENISDFDKIPVSKYQRLIPTIKPRVTCQLRIRTIGWPTFYSCYIQCEEKK